MAESAPLTLSYAHARKAAVETKRSHWNEATREHRAAAEDLSRTAKSSNDTEAKRVLGLLEQQHQALITRIRQLDAANLEVIKTPPVDINPAPEVFSALKQNADAKLKARQTSTTPSFSTNSPTTPPASSPSLAREIASRRGIPQAERYPRLLADAAATSGLGYSDGLRGPPINRLSKMSSQPNSRHTSVPTSTNAGEQSEDDGFAKFYNNITHGTMSKLSSVLAYAGLPLTNTEPLPPPLQKSGRKSVKADNDPDVKKLFSKAALSALEDEHRQRGTLGHGFGPAESFYVVPQSGGMAPYADVVKLHQAQPQTSHRQNLSTEEQDDFVDAREEAGPTSPRSSQRSTTQSVRGPFGGKSQTSEELELENATLKSTLEQLASRLANFEAHAQDASMALLTQSIIGPPPVPRAHAMPNKASSTNDPDAVAAQARIQQLEAMLASQEEGERQLREQNQQQARALQKWDKRFEALNVKAKEKRQAKLDKERLDGNIDAPQHIVQNG